MSRTPYTATITANLGIDADSLMALAQTHGIDSAIGQCAARIQSTLWEMESAERSANEAMSSLRDNTTRQADALAGKGSTFDPSWLTHYATRAAEAGAKLATGAETVRTFKHILNVLIKAA